MSRTFLPIPWFCCCGGLCVEWWNGGGKYGGWKSDCKAWWCLLGELKIYFLIRTFFIWISQSNKSIDFLMWIDKLNKFFDGLIETYVGCIDGDGPWAFVPLLLPFPPLWLVVTVLPLLLWPVCVL